MEALAESRTDVLLRKIDVPGWDAPVLRQYGVRSLPYLVLYESGRQVASGTQRVLGALRKR